MLYHSCCIVTGSTLQDTVDSVLLLLLEQSESTVEDTNTRRQPSTGLPFSSCWSRQSFTWFHTCTEKNRCGGPLTAVPCIFRQWSWLMPPCVPDMHKTQENRQSRWRLQVCTRITVSLLPISNPIWNSHIWPSIAESFNRFGVGHGNDEWTPDILVLRLRMGLFIQAHDFASLHNRVAAAPMHPCESTE